jgi:hypothetical protein
VRKRKKYKKFVIFLEVVTLSTHMPDGERRKHIDMRFVGQRSRSQLLKIEQKLDTCFVSVRYLKNEMSDLNESWYTHA